MQGRLSFLLGAVIVLHFTFRSVIHFGLISVRGVKSVSRFFFFTCGCPVAPAPLVAVLFHCSAFAPLLKISWLYGGLFLGSILSH